MAAVRARVTLDVSGLEELQQAYGGVGDYSLTVGFQGREGKARYIKNGKPGANVASVAMYNEFGVPASANSPGIPARSFLRSAIFEGRSRINREAGNTVSSMHKSPPAASTVASSLEPLGQLMAGMVKDKIRTSLSWAKENAAATEQKKGFNFPLVDTGQMLDSVTWAVRFKGQIMRKGKGR